MNLKYSPSSTNHQTDYTSFPFRFGSGYTVTIRALNYTSGDVIKAFMDDVFPGSTLKVT